METLSRKRETLNAVHDDDLKGVLAELGVQQAFERGQLKCFFCEDTITWDNLYSIFPLGGDVKFSCSKPTCVEELVLQMEKQQAQ